MKATIQKQNRLDDVTSVTLEHTGSGYQIQITQGRVGFVIHSSQGVIFRRYGGDLSYEVEPQETIENE